ncbi:FAD:protein FMN transferase [Sedimenticola thiotaurini]|uniref:FAD:protein FMN transferase n=1 Tax=Sedimenticola thiotaurini TaxID=1543721 RepID=A0A0F7K0V2_9GAMM|nr:FAD:protein FMN transferase [Sedimenticola thiotaurini]AKH20593.1 thiamine biosynthesis protein ApbE [Sedimenticola thiotaurini]
MKYLKIFSWLALLLFLAGCDQSPPDFKGKFLAFGTLVDISIAGVSQQEAQAATDIIENDFKRMHRSWHAWDPGPLGRVNKLLETGGTFSAPPSVLPLIIRGAELSEKSDGLFNPAIGRLIDAWGFHSNDPAGHRPPPQATIDQFLADAPSMSDLHIDGIRMRSSNPAVKLDFGAFGKGYGIDLAVEHLKDLGIQNTILNAGGDLRAIGSHNGQPWRIAIRNPSGEGVLGVIETQGNESIFTSGDYERNFTWEGKRYHHIIDPRTGYPAVGTRSVTVIHNDATTADAAATALFIAGPSRWYEIAQRMGVGYVLLVDTEGTLHMNPAMQTRVALTDTNHTIKLSPPLRVAPAD